MFIHQKSDGHEKLVAICDALGKEELLGQLTEECGELVQAAQKVRRAMKGTTSVTLDEALVMLAEECADEVNCISAMIEAELVDETGVQFISRYKIDRWYDRVTG